MPLPASAARQTIVFEMDAPNITAPSRAFEEMIRVITRAANLLDMQITDPKGGRSQRRTRIGDARTIVVTRLANARIWCRTGRRNRAADFFLTMKDAPVAGRIRELRRKIRAADRAYYDKDSPLMTDAEYDEMFAELRNLEEKNPQFRTANSPTMQVAGKRAARF